MLQVSQFQATSSCTRIKLYREHHCTIATNIQATKNCLPCCEKHFKANPREERTATRGTPRGQRHPGEVHKSTASPGTNGKTDAYATKQTLTQVHRDNPCNQSTLRLQGD